MTIWRGRGLRFAVWLVAFACWLSRPAGAQAGLWLQHESWSTEAGLPQSSVHQILQARDGYLWLATEGGAARYDGVAFRVFGQDRYPEFTSNDVTALAEDGDGSLWFGTADGLVRRARGVLRRFGENDGLPSSNVLALSVDGGGAVLVRTGDGLVRFDGTRFEPVMRDAGFGKAAGGGGGRGGAAAGGRGDDSKVGGSLELPGGGRYGWTDREVTTERGGGRTVWRVGTELPGGRVQSVLASREGTLWIGTNRGLVRVDAGSVRVDAVGALGVNSILSLLEDREGDVWIGTEASGLHALRWRTFRGEPGVAEDEVSAVVQASDGTMWMGTREDGLRHLAAPGGLRPPQVGAGALTSPVILSLAPGGDGDVWVGTPDGLNHVDAGGRVTRYTSSDGLPDDLVRSLVRSRDGTVWIGTRGGLARLRDGRFEAVGAGSGLDTGLIGTLSESVGAGRPDDLWVGTLFGLSRVREGAVKSFGRGEGLASSLVTGMATDPAGRLWVGTRDAGLFVLVGVRFVGVRAAGLPSEIDGVMADGLGFLWMRGRSGVLRVAAADLVGCAGALCGAAVTAYGVEDGLASAERVANGQPQMALTANGALWVATRKGVGIVDTADVRTNPVPPPVAIERFLVDEREMPLGGETLRIASGHARYTFAFAGVSLMLPAKVVYQTRLEGFDRDWSAPGGGRETTYTSLPAGEYTFRVQARNNDGVWNEAGASLSFRVLPPVYRRWWFLLVCGVVLAGVGAGLYRLRVRRLQRSFDAVLAERTRIAREIHDTLAQDMVGTTLQLDVIGQMLAGGRVVEAAAQVKATRGLVKAGLESARQSIWNLRADGARETLPTRVKALVDGLPAGGAAVATKIGGAYRALPVGVEDEMVRVVQEALANVRRHAEAKRATVELAYGEEALVVSVEDDGRGFLPAEGEGRQGHFGLTGMRERAATVGGQLEVVSRPGGGTRVAMTVGTGTAKGRIG